MDFQFKKNIPNANTWSNEFSDRITSMGALHDKGGNRTCYSITIDGKYIKSVSGLHMAKGFINKIRGIKCEWAGSVE